MRHIVRHALALLVAGGLFSVPGAVEALADDLIANDDRIELAFGGVDILSDEQMGDARGGATLTALTSEQSLVSSTNNNALSVQGDLTNGNVTFGDTLGGLGSYAFNTGNNSTVNSALSLNVQFLPSP